MGRGLLGFIGGVGQGLVAAGKTLEDRRREALQAAREEQKFQRALEAEDRKDQRTSAREKANREFTLNRDAERERAADERLKSTQEFQKTEKGEDRKLRREIMTETQKFQKNLAEWKEIQDRRSDDVAFNRRRQLEDEKPDGIKFGKPDADGMAEVIFIYHNKPAKKSGDFAYVGNRRDDDDDKKTPTPMDFGQPFGRR